MTTKKDKHEYKINKFTVTVNEPPQRASEWVTIIDESYKPNREAFIINKFQKDFAAIKVSNCDEIFKLASRSTRLNKWLAEVNAEYALKEKVPTYFRDYVDPSVFKETSEKLTKLRNNNAKQAAEEAELARKYHKEMEDIRNAYKEENDKIVGDDYVTKILNLNSTSMPLSLQLGIENYTPAKEGTSPNKATYAREMLIRFKISLLEAMKANKDANLNELLSGLETK